jgi:ring-1,2-phenylacetyl-CoA epoxidase subunit PaaE
MRASARVALERRGLAPGRIVEESFVSPRGVRVSEFDQSATWVTADGAAHAFAVPPDKTLLEAALDAGLDIPFSCMAGGCGACQVRLLEGEAHARIDAPHRRTPEQIAAAIVPACLCRLTGPVRFPRAVG